MQMIIGFIAGVIWTIIAIKIYTRIALVRGEILLVSENYFTAELKDDSQIRKLGNHKWAVFSVRKKNQSYNDN